MQGKAQREPARHSVVLLHVPKFANCLLYSVHAVRLAVCPNAKI